MICVGVSAQCAPSPINFQHAESSRDVPRAVRGRPVTCSSNKRHGIFAVSNFRCSSAAVAALRRLAIALAPTRKQSHATSRHRYENHIIHNSRIARTFLASGVRVASRPQSCAHSVPCAPLFHAENRKAPLPPHSNHFHVWFCCLCRATPAISAVSPSAHTRLRVGYLLENFAANRSWPSRQSRVSSVIHSKYPSAGGVCADGDTALIRGVAAATSTEPDVKVIGVQRQRRLPIFCREERRSHEQNRATRLRTDSRREPDAKNVRAIASLWMMWFS